MSDRLILGADKLQATPGSTLIAIGNFDGVHSGHRKVLRAAVALARENQLLPRVLTFQPHPMQVLGRGSPEILTNIERKVELITRLSGDLNVVVHPFSRELAQMTPREFSAELLADQLGAGMVLVGENFRFGKGRAGTLHTLVELGQEFGFKAHAEGLYGDGDGTVSSSRIRAAVKAGQLEQAAELLGRPHAVCGTVVHGQHRGRTLGFPTANLDEISELLPPHGVYACLVDDLSGGEPGLAIGRGVANLGVRPTVGAGPSFEVHLFDLDQDLYGRQLRLQLVTRLREERRFDGVDQLREQIAVDCDAARVALRAFRADAPADGQAWY